MLFEKLAQWGFDALVIPHGTTWGIYTPPGSTLRQAADAPRRTTPTGRRLIEVYSGHGNSEEYRDWREIDVRRRRRRRLPGADATATSPAAGAPAS